MAEPIKAMVRRQSRSAMEDFIQRVRLGVFGVLFIWILVGVGRWLGL